MKTPDITSHSLRTRLLCLLAVDVAALVAVGAIGGRFHFRYADLAVPVAVAIAAAALARLFLVRPVGAGRAQKSRA
jgi:hypothetical protein